MSTGEASGTQARATEPTTEEPSRNPFRAAGRGTSLVPVPIYPQYTPPPTEPTAPTFPTTLPTPSQDRFIEPSKPAQFGGKRTEWRNWRLSVENYVACTARRFRSREEVLLEIISATEHGSRPHTVLSNLVFSVIGSNAPGHAELQTLTQPSQVARWTLDQIQIHFRNPLERTFALQALGRPQGGRSISNYLADLDNARLMLDWDFEQVLPFLLLGISPPLKLAIAQRTMKTADAISWSDVENWGLEIEYEEKHYATPTHVAIHRRIPGSNPAPNPSNNPAPTHDPRIKDRLCGNKCSYDGPAPFTPVPAHLRGGIYLRDNMDQDLQSQIRIRNQACLDAQVCESCRRPQSAHPQGTLFRPVKPLA